MRPIGPGQVTIGATLGTDTAPPLLVSVGEGIGGVAGAGALIVTPNPLTVWQGQMGTFGSVMLDPGGGQMPYEVPNYVVTPDPGQAIVRSAGDNMVQGTMEGIANVTISLPDQGISTIAQVHVTKNAGIRIDPEVISLSVGQKSAPIAVFMDGPNGPEGVPASLESLDAEVVSPEEPFQGSFVATGMGETQIQAEYQGATAVAMVTVSGNRFQQVNETVNKGINDFNIGVEVLAAASEGALEYRVYESGQPAPENWIAAQMQGDTQRALISTPQIPDRGAAAVYNIVVEGRDSTGAIQQYPMSFSTTTAIIRDPR